MRTRGRIAKTILAVSVLALPSCAQTGANSPRLSSVDRIIFSNGDVLTGSVSAMNTESVKFSSPVLGEVCIPRETIVKIESDHGTILLASADPSAPVVHARQNRQTGCQPQEPGLGQENPRPQGLPGTLSFRDIPDAQSEQTAPTIKSTAPKKSATPNTLWFFNINAPASVAFGTTSQETYGGLMDLEFYQGKVYHSKISASGSYNRSWQVGSPSIFTDVFDGYFQQSRSLGPNRGGLYGRAEWFFNTALGLAREQSFGAGYSSRSKRVGPFQLLGLADLRYFGERLYGTPGNLNLVGSRFEGQLTYRKKDSEDPTKTKYSVITRAWANPIWNKEDALQAFATVQIGFPIGRSICFSFNPIEDDYLRNAPAGKKANYVTSSVSLQIKRTYDPKQGCY